jgi:hypothetical protein
VHYYSVHYNLSEMQTHVILGFTVLTMDQRVFDISRYKSRYTYRKISYNIHNINLQRPRMLNYSIFIYLNPLVNSFITSICSDLRMVKYSIFIYLNPLVNSNYGLENQLLVVSGNSQNIKGWEASRM